MYAIPIRAYIDILEKIGPFGKFENELEENVQGMKVK